MKIQSWALLGVLFLIMSYSEGAEVQSPDYVGFKNNGSGRFEHCKPPTQWDEVRGANIAWKTPMPSWTASSPIVVSNRVITLAEPNLVLCVDLENGNLLWQTAIDQTLLLPEEKREEARTLYANWRARYSEELAKAVELQVLKDRLLCIDGKADKAFSGNFMLGMIDKSLKQRAVESAKASPKKDIEAMRARAEALQKEVLRGMTTPSTDITWPQSGSGEEWNEGRKLLAEYGYQFETWYGHMGHTFATPVSDCEFVYVSMGWGQVAALDLNGGVKWMRWFKVDGTPQLRYTNSPLLVGKTLIVIAGGAIRAFDTRNGDIIWQSIYPPPRISMGQNHAGSPLCVRLGKTDLIITSHGRIYRASDGKIMTENLPEVVASPAVDGNLVFLSSGGVHGTTGKVKALAYRMTLSEDGEALSLECVWETPLGGRAGMWTGPTCLGGLLYYAYPQNVLVLKASTGELVASHVPNEFDYSGSHAINTVTAGGYVFTGLESDWGVSD